MCAHDQTFFTLGGVIVKYEENLFAGFFGTSLRIVGKIFGNF